MARSPARNRVLLHPWERAASAALAVGCLVLAVTLAVSPPDRTVPVPGCTAAPPTCAVTVDGDVGTFAAALLALGALAAVVAVLGIRFTTVKAAGFEAAANYADETAGLPRADPRPEPATTADAGAPPPEAGPGAEVPFEVSVRHDLGRADTAPAPVPVTTLREPMTGIAPDVLRDYRSARKRLGRGYVVTHILGPRTRADQRFSVAVKVIAIRRADVPAIRAVWFYLGPAWGNRVFGARRGEDGNFGIVTEAHGPFLVLCEIECEDGERVLLDHYCDFEMGGLIPG